MSTFQGGKNKKWRSFAEISSNGMRKLYLCVKIYIKVDKENGLHCKELNDISFPYLKKLTIKGELESVEGLVTISMPALGGLRLGKHWYNEA